MRTIGLSQLVDAVAAVKTATALVRDELSNPDLREGVITELISLEPELRDTINLLGDEFGPIFEPGDQLAEKISQA
jgi:hypothetical protein